MARAAKQRGRQEVLRAYAAAKPGATEDHPWADDLVYKVGEKIFVFFGSAGRVPPSIMVSCGDAAEEWCARYPASISPGPYIGRFGWNSVLVDADVPLDELRELIDTSYDRVVSRLPTSKRP